jgi:NTP pyrophosphatase (non-canonical NTP hydrolase)
METYIDLQKYMEEVRAVCQRKKWKKDWSHGGCYMHLEVSEFIEALRGKGDPIEELGDVLFTIFAVADHYNIDPIKGIEHNRNKLSGI